MKINFNGGDWLFAHGDGVINYHGSGAEWGPWFADFLGLARPAFILLMGDERPMHAEAIAIARAVGIRVFVLEEGYLRPDFITCELNGVNANSPMPRQAQFYAQDAGAPGAHSQDVPARGLADTGHVQFGRGGFGAMAVSALCYYVAKTFGSALFLRYRHHRRRQPLAEIFLWTRNLVRKLRHYHANHKMMIDLVEHHDKRYFLVALQVSDDMQLVAHGRGWTVERLITAAIKSFSQHGEPGDLLVFKGHPMDRGHFPHGGLIREIARLAGCEERVRFIDDGSIGLMIRHARGLVSINSTSGLSALHHGTPLLCLGEAIYKIPGLVAGSGSLADMDRFWTAPASPAPALARNFLAAIRRTCLVNGTFYARSGFAVTFKNLIARIEDAGAGAGSGAIGAPVAAFAQRIAQIAPLPAAAPPAAVGESRARA